MTMQTELDENDESNLSERVKEDSKLTPAEKETTFWFDKKGDTATAFTSEAGLMRRLLAHPYAEVVDTVEEDGNVHGVRAKLPVGCLTVSSNPRTSGGHANVITRTVLESNGDDSDE